MTKQQLIKGLYKLIDKFGTQKELANKLQVTPAYLNDVLNGRREPNKEFLAQLHLKKVVRYEKITT
jgi:transcriptional regulator with XRE-family HTH domain